MEQKQPEKKKRGKRYALVGGMLLLLLYVGCATPTPSPTPTLDTEATKVAMARAVEGTMTALAPTLTPTQTHSPTPTITQTPANTATPRPTFTAIPTPPGGKWRTEFGTSAFDDTRTVSLHLDAEHSITGWLETHIPTLILRCKESKVEAYVIIGMDADVERGMTDDATIRVRFDKEEALSLTAGKSTSGDALFFRFPLAMISNMLNHDEMVFGFTPFNASPVVTAFELRGLSEVIRPLQESCGLLDNPIAMRYPTPTPAPGVCVQIASPEPNTEVRGIVPIIGSTQVPDFFHYLVSVGRGPDPLQWFGPESETDIMTHFSIVDNGLIDTWNTTKIPDGTYTLRLWVIGRDASCEEIFVRQVVVANTHPMPK